MLVQATSKNEEFKYLFNKSFKNFAKKTPVKLTFSLTDSFCLVDVLELNYSKTFHINYDLPVDKFIKKIRDWLYSTSYPRMKEVFVETRPLTYFEIDELIKQGEDPDRAITTKKTSTEIIEYVIEKVMLRKDEVIVRNRNSNVLSLYSLSMPSGQFIRKALHEWTEEETFKVFNNIATLSKQGLPDSMGDVVSE